MRQQKIEVRDVLPNDYNDIKRMAQSLTRAARLPAIDEETLQVTFANLSQKGILKVAVSNTTVGFAAALVYPYFWNAKIITAQIVCWWVDESFRGTSTSIELLDAVEKAAKAKGATRLMMASQEELSGCKIGSKFKRRGYRPLEKNYVKEL